MAQYDTTWFEKGLAELVQVCGAKYNMAGSNLAPPLAQD